MSLKKERERENWDWEEMVWGEIEEKREKSAQRYSIRGGIFGSYLCSICFALVCGFDGFSLLS